MDTANTSALPEPRAISGGSSAKPRGTSRPPKAKTETPHHLSGFPTADIPPKPSEILHLPIERAQMLATFPRSKWGEFYWAALTGFLGALPGAAQAIYDAYFKPQATGLTLFGLLMVSGAIVFLTLLIRGILANRGAKTSLEFLDELCSASSQTTRPSPRRAGRRIAT
jgi:hypothetical protein